MSYKDEWTVLYIHFMRLDFLQCGASNAPFDHTVFNWFRQFQRNKFSVQHASCSGRPSTSVTKQTIWWFSFNVSINRGHIRHQFHCNQFNNSSLFKSKKSLCSMGVAYTNQWPKVQFCRYSLKRFEEGRSRRIFDIITGDESCFYHYDPELKE